MKPIIIGLIIVFGFLVIAAIAFMLVPPTLDENSNGKPSAEDINNPKNPSPSGNDNQTHSKDTDNTSDNPVTTSIEEFNTALEGKKAINCTYTRLDPSSNKPQAQVLVQTNDDWSKMRRKETSIESGFFKESIFIEEDGTYFEYAWDSNARKILIDEPYGGLLTKYSGSRGADPIPFVVDRFVLANTLADGTRSIIAELGCWPSSQATFSIPSDIKFSLITEIVGTE